MIDPLVTVIILNWNGGSHVIQCIEDVLAQSYTQIGLIVVDNGSSDGSKEAIHSQFPNIQIIENDVNLGFATGMNQGLEHATGEFALLLNQDAWIQNDFVATAVQIMRREHTTTGMLAAHVYKLDDYEKTNQFLSGGLYLRRRFQLIGDPDFLTEHYTLSPVYCCPFFRMEMLHDVRTCIGYFFDDSYFAYWEDMDLSLRAQLRGWKCLYSPSLVSWHAHSLSLGGKVRLWEKPPAFRTYSLRNRYLTIIKDVPIGLLVYLLPYLVFTEILTWPYLIFHSPSTIPCLARAYKDTIRMFLRTLRQRRIIQSQRKVSSLYLKRYCRTF